MAQEVSRFWDYDEVRNNEYQADELAEVLRTCFFDGVPELGTNLQVYADDSGMQVKLDYGYAIIQGTLYKLADDSSGVLTKGVASAHASQTRIDRIILRRDKSAAVASVIAVYLPGTPSASPQPPALTREGNIYELSLAQFAVTPGTLSITAAMIIDERDDNDLCGLCENRVTRDRLDAMAAALAEKANISHTQAMSTITGLADALAGKADAAATETALAGKASTSHTQAIDTITGLVTALAGKLSTADGAVGANNLGVIQTFKLDTGDTITYNPTTNQVFLNISGCTSVQLAPIVFGTSAPPPAGTYPKGTVYFQHEE